MVIRKYWLIRICIAVIAITVLILLLNYYKIIEVSMGVSTTDKVIVIDPGHGGFDPGKLGSNGRKNEKDINLDISLYLKAYLEQNDFVVIMTREKDEDLYTEDGSNRKMKTIDLTNRKKIVLDMKPDVFISIHANSFQESKYYGAQTFYPKNNEEGMKLANIIQQEFMNIVDPDNKRVPLENDTVYIIKGLDIPTVLIECGFLSNPEEERKLNDPQYQQKIAWSIYVGLEKYFKTFVQE
ncbi:N-acetylmuramoyl-L-alanine amidase CwlD [Alkaliphilus oremlandii OhILAs]|uniref:N-acetylmuramoyl-L-alanine amidase CwlD n=1 Tax=Alkaliphilus oremlandii (strain OhILAs) TaxID=350688 RepID=A8MLH8_ALKOO|nr:N-acetylmuramoyl-L-alanine amidase CwlD [Alkaliphilus oremlandii OhILAs]